MKVSTLLLWIAALIGCGGALRASEKQLQIYWIDTEGGGATLIVTPAGESVLVDAGNPGARDSGRIQRVASEVAGLKRIDHLVVTHFHLDHFGGVADLADLMPVGVLYDKGLPGPGEPPDAGGNVKLWAVTSAPYREAKVERRVTLKAGDSLSLRQVPGGAPITCRCVAANRQRMEPPPGTPLNPVCGEKEGTVAPDPTDNAASVVLILEMGEFRFFDGGDLTLAMEEKLVCPRNLVGSVDLFQVNHHGLAVSNHERLVQALAPTVAVMNNGPRKGTSGATLAALRSSPNLEALYQVHENVRDDHENNAPPEHIANLGDLGEACSAHGIRCSVAPDGNSYAIEIPHRGYSRSFKTRPKKR